MSDPAAPSSTVARLPRRGVVAVRGADATALLDRLLTADLDGLAPPFPAPTLTAGTGLAAARCAALLSPQGRILAEMIVIATADGYLLDVAGGATAAADLVKRLTLYKLRADVTLVNLSADHTVVVAAAVATDVAAVPAAAALAGALAVYDDPRAPAGALGHRAILPRARADRLPETAVADEARRISARVPEAGMDYALGDLVPHEALLDRLGAVSFTKGCYVGQEIVSRMEHRGTARKRFVRVTAGAALPPAGTPVTAGEATLGAMGSSVPADADGRAHGLALLRLDRLAEMAAKGHPIVTGGVAITPDPEDVAALMPRTPDPIALDR